ncbi:hypothetical protein SFMTTN_3025 [Sulfuriferula multivorans]|uniref:Uncharacterized protein n=1 Tax=Sulfuriferula multivorans TaxID=1559896 RepID=A0A401K0N9_9PROT|nr:hypothetical protein [Sulfuriferula multivorans]GCB02205.1 hypothetical protein SFMTTN_3025 [Sulfuriferula multivorans]
MAQRIQTQLAKSAFMALVLTISFATMAATTSAASYPKDGSKETLAKQNIVPEISGGEAVSPYSTKNRVFEKKRSMQQNKPRWT